MTINTDTKKNSWTGKNAQNDNSHRIGFNLEHERVLDRKYSHYMSRIDKFLVYHTSTDISVMTSSSKVNYYLSLLRRHKPEIYSRIGYTRVKGDFLTRCLVLSMGRRGLIVSK